MYFLRQHRKVFNVSKVILARSIAISVARHQEVHVKNETFEHTLSNIENGIQRITLHSLKKRNALSLAMLDELKQHLIDSSDSKDVRVIILGHSGPVFSAGHDLKELTKERGSDYHVKIFQRCTEVMNLVQDIHKPVIAEVNDLYSQLTFTYSKLTKETPERIVKYVQV